VQLVVGRIGRAHGVHGEVAVEVRTDDVDQRFAPGTQLATDPPEQGPLTVVRARPHSGRLLVAFAELTGRDAAEAKRGTLLVADSSTSAATDDPDEYWDHDLVGLHVVTVDGESVGNVEEVLHLPGQDVLLVRRGDAELLVPFVTAFVPTIDVAAGRIVIDPPPGLLHDAAED
jgi:16S rRNA processing protein RimM